MQLDPMQSWRQLTEHYGEMSDGELIALAEDFGDLTDMARQVLRDEMRKRNLGDPQSSATTQSSQSFAAQSSVGASLSTESNADIGNASPEDFVWKNTLCNCDDHEQAWQIYEVLRRAGIESWIERTWDHYSPIPDSGPRVLVASDRLEDARAVLAHPIPHDVTEESKAGRAEYRLPVCPACGTPDPILESNEPANCWKCEVCGRQWSEAAEPAGEPSERG